MELILEFLTFILDSNMEFMTYVLIAIVILVIVFAKMALVIIPQS